MTSLRSLYLHTLNKHFGTYLIVVTTKLLVIVINLHARPPPGAPNHVVTNFRCWLMASCSSKVYASKHSISDEAISPHLTPDNLLATIWLLSAPEPGLQSTEISQCWPLATWGNMSLRSGFSGCSDRRLLHLQAGVTLMRLILKLSGG